MPTFQLDKGLGGPAGIRRGGSSSKSDLGIERLNDIRPHAASCAGTCSSKSSSEVINDFSQHLRDRLLRHRGDPQRLQAIAVPTQHLEPEAVEREALARLRDRACLVNDEAR